MNKKDIKKDILIKVAIIIGIVIVINVISKRIFTRVDLTKNRTYTLSTISKDIVKNLGDKLVIKAYFSDNLPSPYNNLRRNLQDILNDYRSYSNGNLNYEFLNPSGDTEQSEMEKEATKYGIQPVQIQVVDNDKLEVKKAFLGLVFLYQGKQEVIPVVQSMGNIEYEITNMIKRLTTEKKKKIGFIQGHGEYDYTKFTQINNVLNSQYDVVRVDVSKGNPVPADIDVLIVMGPKSDFPEAHKFMIDQFIMRGGNIAWLINKVVPNFQQQIVLGDVVKTNLDDMLSNYGVVINNDLIRDLQCSAVQVQSQIGIPISINYPYFPVVTNIDRENSAFKNIQSVILSFVSSLDITQATAKNVAVKPLLTTSDKSGKAEGFFLLNLEQYQNLTKKAADTLFGNKGFVVGAIYTGKFSSFYAGKEIPKDTAQDANPFSGQKLDFSSKESKQIVIGDGDFANEEQRPPKDNLVFFVNMVDYLADDVGLSEIRGKDSSEAPIEETSDATKKFIKYFNLIVPPGIVLLVGFFIWNKRKLRKKNLQSK
ncbi:MAG: GldG family protein [Ignavibacteria bacterium]|jgi:gliding-associated putative ABC transporter substrate-binding component GldG